ncbi:HAD-IIB family hydrolase [Haploplasma axanthum]|uniref:HAD superfamily hydrolase Cof n=1 Tax=Haploplasma axanthum TaxID=29552 RepID=A0A449BDU6_HAPAX|nr:HAD family hydrolase [Haploplasma axanthum]VEU80480.1 HAD superfamily hydrolase Cof [Haploplasma axanthum]
MKKFIFFDLDNTIHSTKNKEIPSQTIDLIKKLALMPNTYVGLATGRGPSKVHMLEGLEELFTYKIFINGSVAYKNNKLIYSNPLKLDDIEQVLKETEKEEVSVGFVTIDKEYVNEYSLEVDYGIKGFGDKVPEINPKIYIEKEVYQLWLFSRDKEKINKITSKSNFLCYPWHSGGADLVDRNTNKAIAIAKVLENETDYQLITVGDGHNDIEMIKLADIGIAMGNSGFPELKEKANYVAPHIDSNQLYDFFKELKIID